MTERYSHLIVTELKKEPEMTPEFRELYNSFARRILWIDDDVVPGAFQMNTSWYCSVLNIWHMPDAGPYTAPGGPRALKPKLPPVRCSRAVTER